MNDYVEPDAKGTKKDTEQKEWRITLVLDDGVTQREAEMRIVHSQIHNAGFLVQGRMNELADRWIPKKKGRRK